ncbi:UNVERIFIED_CONTAM: hypothetical protein GTU68_047613 [Idotea baltica]|nr:hypothetical protein [Idotea baltica]
MRSSRTSSKPERRKPSRPRPPKSRAGSAPTPRLRLPSMRPSRRNSRTSSTRSWPRFIRQPVEPHLEPVECLDKVDPKAPKSTRSIDLKFVYTKTTSSLKYYYYLLSKYFLVILLMSYAVTRSGLFSVYVCQLAFSSLSSQDIT